MDPALIAELHADGVDVAGADDLATVLGRLQTRIVDVATADPEAFDRPLYDRLMRSWHILSVEAPPDDRG